MISQKAYQLFILTFSFCSRLSPAQNSAETDQDVRAYLHHLHQPVYSFVCVTPTDFGS